MLQCLPAISEQVELSQLLSQGIVIVRENGTTHFPQELLGKDFAGAMRHLAHARRRVIAFVQCFEAAQQGRPPRFRALRP